MLETDEINDEQREEQLRVDSFEQKILKFIRCSRVAMFWGSMNTQITNNFVQAGILLRPADSNGLWCCALLPAILVIYSSLYKVSALYHLVTCVSVGLFVLSVLYIMFLFISCLALREDLVAGGISSACFALMPLYLKYDQDLLISATFPLLGNYLFIYFFKTALVDCQKTFTLGEAMLVSQGVTLFIVMAVADLFLYGRKGFEDPDDKTHLINCCVFTVLSTVGLLVTALYKMDDSHRNVTHLSFLIYVGILYTLTVVHLLYGWSCLIAILSFIGSRQRIWLISFWALLLMASVVLLYVNTQKGKKADTVKRKAFHLLGSLVFTTGILIDVQFMTLAAGLVFGLLILVEALRKSRIEPISSFLQSTYEVYCDEKDCGEFAMTPIYLYVGLACPLALVPRGPCLPLDLLSGVLAIGVGDSAASVFGKTIGQTKWAGGERTLEGTAFNVLSQIVAIYLLSLFGLIDTPLMFLRVAVAATISALVEARTSQVDNLVLPLVTILAFQLTSVQ